MATARITVAVHRLTGLFGGEPDAQLTRAQIAELTGLDEADAGIVIDTLKDAGYLIEREPDRLGRDRPHPAA